MDPRDRSEMKFDGIYDDWELHVIAITLFDVKYIDTQSNFSVDVLLL